MSAAEQGHDRPRHTMRKIPDGILRGQAAPGSAVSPPDEGVVGKTDAGVTSPARTGMDRDDSPREASAVHAQNDADVAYDSPLDHFFDTLGVREDAPAPEKAPPQEKTADREAKPRPTARRVFSVIATVVACFLVAFLITQFVLSRNTVKGTSMVPTLQDGDEIFVEKISRLFENGLKRLDIVTADTHRKAPSGDEMIIIKRVIGLPGERVRIANGAVYINDRRLLEPYLPETVRTYPHNPEYADVLLGEDEYFILGDNRDNSQDSRDIGPVKRQNIEGKLLFRCFPLSRFGVPD